MGGITGSILYRNASRITVPSEKASKFSFLSKKKDYITIVPNGMEIEYYKETTKKIS